MIPEGYCQCGCGQKTNLAQRTEKRFGWIKGKPLKFIKYHRNYSGERSWNWNNGKTIRNGYPVVLLKNHPRATDGYVLEHIVQAEKAMGKPLPPLAEIHHFPNKKQWSHLVICQDHAYHFLLELRQKAVKAGAKPTARKCYICKQWDNPTNLYINNHAIYHRSCHEKYEATRR